MKLYIWELSRYRKIVIDEFYLVDNNYTDKLSSYNIFLKAKSLVGLFLFWQKCFVTEPTIVSIINIQYTYINYNI